MGYRKTQRCRSVAASEAPQLPERRGFQGSLRVIGEWATRRRRSERADAANLQRVPSARTIARLMTAGRDHLPKAQTITVVAIEDGVPAVVTARSLILDFQTMIRKRTPSDLQPWLETAGSSLVASFARGIISDQKAVRAAMTSLWSNG